MCVQVLLPICAFRLLNMHHISWPRSGERKWKSRLRLYTRVNFWLALPRKWNSNDFNMPAGILLRLMFNHTGIIFKKNLKSQTNFKIEGLWKEFHISRFSDLSCFRVLFTLVCYLWPSILCLWKWKGVWELRKSNISLKFKFT